MANYRRDRVNEEITREMAEILRTVKDPRVSTAFISVTGVDCAADMKTAKIYYSSIGGKDKDEGVARGLSCAAGYIRRELAVRLNLRQTPELRFIHDNSIERGAHIAKLLHDVGADRPVDNGGDSPEGEGTDAGK